MTTKHHLTKRFLLLSSIIGFVYSQSALAVDEAYISSIKADVSEFSSGTFENSPNNAWTRGSASAVLDGTASLDSFEKFLKKLFPGTYILFGKLSMPEKTVVWQDYVKTGDTNGIRKNIFASFKRGS